MKIVSLVSLVSIDKEGNQVTTLPGVVDVDEETAKQLLARGQAKSLEDAKAEAKAEAEGVTVKQQAKPAAKPSGK